MWIMGLGYFLRWVGHIKVAHGCHFGVIQEYEFWVLLGHSYRLLFWVLSGALYGLGNCFMAEEKKKGNTDLRVWIHWVPLGHSCGLCSGFSVAHYGLGVFVFMAEEKMGKKRKLIKTFKPATHCSSMAVISCYILSLGAESNMRHHQGLTWCNRGMVMVMYFQLLWKIETTWLGLWVMWRKSNEARSRLSEVVIWCNRGMVMII